MDIEILKPFGPSIVKVQLPLEMVNQMNDYTDTIVKDQNKSCLLYTSPSPRDQEASRMPSSA